MMKSVISPRHRREPLFLRCGNVQVVFRWHGDRWKHEIMLMHSVDGSLSSIFFRSVEGPHSMRGDAHWPCSPSLVELDTLRQPGSNVILAVGMAGRSHFSLSISAPQTKTPNMPRMPKLGSARTWPSCMGSETTYISTPCKPNTEYKLTIGKRSPCLRRID